MHFPCRPVNFTLAEKIAYGDVSCPSPGTENIITPTLLACTYGTDTGVNYVCKERTRDRTHNIPSSNDKRIRMAFSSLPSSTATRPINDKLTDDPTSPDAPTAAIVVVVIGVPTNKPPDSY